MNVNDQVGMNITFLSPIAPDNMRHQSLIFSYLNVDVFSIDGQNHEVELYADISAGKCRQDFWEPSLFPSSSPFLTKKYKKASFVSSKSL